MIKEHNQEYQKELICKALQISVGNLEIDRLTREQTDFILHDINIPCFLEACPGSGKTEIVGLKASYEINNWTKKYAGFAVLSFTNNASLEIQKRISKYSNFTSNNHPHFVGTFDSWLFNYIFIPFAHKHCKFEFKKDFLFPKQIFDERDNQDFLKYFTVRDFNNIYGMPIRANNYYYDLNLKDFVISQKFNSSKVLKTIIEEYNQKNSQQNYEVWRNLFKNTKSKFWHSGYFIFQDIEGIVFYLLQNINLINLFSKRFPIIIIDEAQDLSPLQLLILEMLINKGCKIHLIGDLKQSIYEFRHVKPNSILEFVNNNSLSTKRLTDNFRSNQNIVDFCEKIISTDGSLKGKESILLSPVCCYIEYDNANFNNLPKLFDDIITKINSLKDRVLINKNKSVILSRGRTLIDEITNSKNSSDNQYALIANSIFYWYQCDKNKITIENALLALGKFFSISAFNRQGNKQNYYCPSNCDLVEWRFFLSYILTTKTSTLYNSLSNDTTKINWSRWAKLVKDFYNQNYNNFPIEPITELETILKKQIVKGTATQFVLDDLNSKTKMSEIKINTIHSAKGETYDAVMLVSSKDKHSQGGHYTDWFNENPQNDSEEEFKRFGYVACSRPKHLLILALPKLDTTWKSKFTNIGITELDINNLEINVI